jgi:uracil-DNA glycosylase
MTGYSDLWGNMNSIEKKAALLQLAQLRKLESFEGYSRKYLNLCDFFSGYYECDHVVPWTLSACNVEADLMLISQDWSSEEFLLARGEDPQARKLGHSPDLPTNQRTQAMLKEHMGLSFGDTYATDAFAFIKPGKMNSPISFPDLLRSVRTYTLPQISIVRPKMVICLGSAPFNAIRRGLGKPDRINLTRSFQVETPFHTDFEGIPIFGVAHPGGVGTRAIGGQAVALPRWQTLGEYFRTISA